MAAQRAAVLPLAEQHWETVHRCTRRPPLLCRDVVNDRRLQNTVRLLDHLCRPGGPRPVWILPQALRLKHLLLNRHLAFRMIKKQTPRTLAGRPSKGSLASRSSVVNHGVTILIIVIHFAAGYLCNFSPDFRLVFSMVYMCVFPVI